MVEFGDDFFEVDTDVTGSALGEWETNNAGGRHKILVMLDEEADVSEVVSG